MPDTLPFIPNQSYKSRNLAPEQIFADQVRELAWALADAEKMGKLNPTVDRYALPTALTENSSNMGVVDPGIVDKSSNIFGLHLHEQPGGRPPRLVNHLEGVDQQRENMDRFQVQSTQGLPEAAQREIFHNLISADLQAGRTERGTPQMQSYALVTALTDLAKRYPGNLALERWNGAGPGARNHRAKVEAQQSILQDPRNAELMQYFNQFRRQPEEYP